MSIYAKPSTITLSSSLHHVATHNHHLMPPHPAMTNEFSTKFKNFELLVPQILKLIIYSSIFFPFIFTYRLWDEKFLDNVSIYAEPSTLSSSFHHVATHNHHHLPPHLIMTNEPSTRFKNFELLVPQILKLINYIFINFFFHLFLHTNHEMRNF